MAKTPTCVDDSDGRGRRAGSECVSSLRELGQAISAAGVHDGAISAGCARRDIDVAPGGDRCGHNIQPGLAFCAISVSDVRVENVPLKVAGRVRSCFVGNDITDFVLSVQPPPVSQMPVQ